MPDTPERVVIIGAGLAGANCAVALRDAGFHGEMTLVGDEDHAPYGRPPLSKTYLRGEETLESWTVKSADWYASNTVDWRRGVTATAIEAAAQHIVLDDGQRVEYSKLVLCTGGRARRPKVPGSGLSGVHVLRTLRDCDAIKAVAKPGARAVVVGMGFIGSEVAASLRQLDVDVTAVFSGAGPLETVLGDDVAGVFARIHRDHGVTLVANARAVAFEGADHVERVLTDTGERIACDFAVVGAGIEPLTELAEAAGITLDNGIAVDSRCHTSVPHIYAAGDVANHRHPLFGRVRVEHYNNAEKMGAAVARSVLGDQRPYDYVHTFWSDQYEHKLEYVGHATRWERFIVRGSLRDGFLGFYLTAGVLRAAVGFDRGGDPELEEDSEMHAVQSMIAKGSAPSASLLADETVDLRELARTAQQHAPP